MAESQKNEEQWKRTMLVWLPTTPDSSVLNPTSSAPCGLARSGVAGPSARWCCWCESSNAILIKNVSDSCFSNCGQETTGSSWNYLVQQDKFWEHSEQNIFHKNSLCEYVHSHEVKSISHGGPQPKDFTVLQTHMQDLHQQGKRQGTRSGAWSARCSPRIPLA